MNQIKSFQKFYYKFYFFFKNKTRNKANNTSSPWITDNIAKSSKCIKNPYEKFIKNRKVKNESKVVLGKSNLIISNLPRKVVVDNAETF